MLCVRVLGFEIKIKRNININIDISTLDLELVQQLDRKEEADTAEPVAEARVTYSYVFSLPPQRLAHATLEENLPAFMVWNEMYQSALEVC